MIGTAVQGSRRSTGFGTLAAGASNSHVLKARRAVSPTGTVFALLTAMHIESFGRRVVVAALALASLAGQAKAADSVAVIVNSRNAGSQIKRDSLAAIFLQSGTRWSDGKPARPVDQSTRSAARAAFSEQVLRLNLMAVQRHWMNALSAGATPPPVKGSDDEVIAFVRSNPTAIGYVSTEAPLDPDVKVVKVIE